MAEIPERVAKLEVKHKNLESDVRDIKLQVSNHIPTAIEEIKDAVDALVIQHTTAAAVKKAAEKKQYIWDLTLKRFLMCIGLIWTVLRVLEYARGM